MAFEGRAGQVRVGHFIQGTRRTLDDIWEVLEMKNPDQIRYGEGLWWRVANTTTGEEAAIPPKMVNSKVRFMLTPEEHELAEERRRPPDLPHQYPIDSEEVLLLVEQLGAREIATRDNETGEITCPNYAEGMFHTVDEITHLRICHGLDVSGLEAIGNWEERMIATIKAHGELHSAQGRKVAHKGFPHRHVPEDHSIL
jgi:hypothetical protein